MATIAQFKELKDEYLNAINAGAELKNALKNIAAAKTKLATALQAINNNEAFSELSAEYPAKVARLTDLNTLRQAINMEYEAYTQATIDLIDATDEENDPI